MDVKVILMILVVGVVYVTSSGHVKWDYEKKGPSTWAKTFPTCGGKKQSPINIDTGETSKTLSRNIFSHNYWEKTNGSYGIINNGHALQINLPTDNKYRLNKGKNVYKPLQVHIHFDPVTGKGSEHTLNSKKYFAEIHIVHANTKYETQEEYMGHSDGLLVIGMFVDKVASKKPSFALKVFGGAASKLTKPESKKVVSAFPLIKLFPIKNRKNSKLGYVNYEGSLTTPPCSEIVDWIVITGKTLVCSQNMADNLSEVLNAENTLMAGNNRPIMDLNNRKVYGVYEERLKRSFR